MFDSIYKMNYFTYTAINIFFQFRNPWLSSARLTEFGRFAHLSFEEWLLILSSCGDWAVHNSGIKIFCDLLLCHCLASDQIIVVAILINLEFHFRAATLRYKKLRLKVTSTLSSSSWSKEPASIIRMKWWVMDNTCYLEVWEEDISHDG